MSAEGVAPNFVCHAIQEWFDPDDVKIAAVQAVLDAAGFDAKATCWPVFGGLWPTACEGPAGTEATTWLRQLTDTMVRGNFEVEVAHVVKAIDTHRGGDKIVDNVE